QVARADGDKDVHAAAPGIDEAGLDLHEFPDADRPVEVNIADRGGDAAPTTPLRAVAWAASSIHSSSLPPSTKPRVPTSADSTWNRWIVSWPHAASRVACCIDCILAPSAPSLQP